MQTAPIQLTIKHLNSLPRCKYIIETVADSQIPILVLVVALGWMVWVVTGRGRVVVASLQRKEQKHTWHFTPKLKSYTSIQEFFNTSQLPVIFN